MRQSSKIDTSFGERRGVLELLERLREEELGLVELEDIGGELKRSGVKALRPLLRELGRETKGELISKYAYILDFFDEEQWLDQLIRIALKRRDLPEDAKAAFQVALKGYGVDLQEPPFRQIFSSPDLEQALKGRPGNEGLVRFLDDFLSYPADIQQHVLKEMPYGADRRGIRMLEALLWHEEAEIVEGALRTLGKVRDRSAASVLNGYLEEGKEEFLPACRKSLRRLQFLGVQPEEEPAPLPFHAGYASVPDGDGYRALFLSRWIGPGKVSALYMQVHERRGLLAAWGGDALTVEEFRTELDAFSAEDPLYAVEPKYVVELVTDALYWSRDLAYLPADFYLQRYLFRGIDLTPRRHHADLSRFLPTRALTYQEGEEVTATLLSDPFFAGWFMAEQRVYDFASEHGTGDEKGILERFCAELVAPQLDRIKERLLLCAELMLCCNRDKRSIAKVVGLAHSLEGYRLPTHLHPFLRGFARESLLAARGALSQGYDPGQEAEQQVD